MTEKSTNGHGTFGDTIRSRRAELALTQEQVAEQVRVKPNYIGYLERGMRRPSDEICCRIADTLGLDREHLFFLANPHLRDILNGTAKPEGEAAWEVFGKDKQLHKRQNITQKEFKVLEQVSNLGEVNSPRDFLFVLTAIRQSLRRG